jgi:hypothetical protein
VRHLTLIFAALLTVYGPMPPLHLGELSLGQVPPCQSGGACGGLLAYAQVALDGGSGSEAGPCSGDTCANCHSQVFDSCSAACAPGCQRLEGVGALAYCTAQCQRGCEQQALVTCRPPACCP